MPLPVRVVVGVDGSGRTYRLHHLAPQQSLVVPRRASAASVRDLITACGRDLLLLDDAHDCSPEVLAAVGAAVAAGSGVALARRPGVMSAPLAELEDAVLQAGSLLTLRPLTRAEIAWLLADGVGTADPAAVEAVLTASGGAGWVVAALHDDRGPYPGRAGDLDRGPAAWPTLQAAVERRLARLGAAAGTDAVELVHLMAVAADLTEGVDEHVLSAALAGDDNHGPQRSAILTGQPWRHLWLAGLLDDPSGAPGVGRPVPAVARLVRQAMTPPERRACLARLAGGVRAGGSDGLLAATGHVARAAATVDAVLAAANGWAAQARTDRVAACLAESGLPLHRSLAVPALVALGRGHLAAQLLSEADTDPADVALLFARAVASTGDRELRDALPGLIEAAERFQIAAVSAAVPETPHAVAAVLAVAAGDHATAARLLGSATMLDVGGPPARLRHRLLTAWLRLRAGRLDPLPVAQQVLGEPVDPRDALLRTVLLAGSARRRSDIVGLRACWDQVAHELARRCVDLFALEMVEELVLAAVRLEQGRRAAGMVADLSAMASSGTAAWQSGVAWLQLQMAVILDDADAAAAAAAHAGAAAVLDTAGPRQRAQAVAAVAWAAVMAGHVDTDGVLVAVAALVDDAELPWEGGRLAGAGAVRTTDPRGARRLLERARELSWAAQRAVAGTTVTAGTADASGVSEREFEVARLVLAGRTHREIGSQLFISPKTVEHHVARIRTKVGARDRTEFITALRVLVDLHGGSGGSD